MAQDGVTKLHGITIFDPNMQPGDHRPSSPAKVTAPLNPWPQPKAGPPVAAEAIVPIDRSEVASAPYPSYSRVRRFLPHLQKMSLRSGVTINPLDLMGGEYCLHPYDGTVEILLKLSQDDPVAKQMREVALGGAILALIADK